MGFAAATFSGLRQPFTWSGRATRSEYWWFHLASVAATAAMTWLILLPALEPAAGALLAEDPGLALSLMPPSDPAILACSAASTWLAFAHWAALVRRLHDIGRSGWWQLLAVVPLIGAAALLVMMLLPSRGAANRWGPPPGGAPAAEPAMRRDAPAWTPPRRAGKRAAMSIDDLRAMRHARMPSPSQAAYRAVLT